MDLEHIFREESGRILATLIAMLGSFDLAEEAMQEAFTVALEKWPIDGTPANPSACFVQYRAPTEPGSSGSPVFEAALWRVIALHHAGAEAMRKLNGKPGTWAANEGIWIQSIVKAAASATIKPAPAI